MRKQCLCILLSVTCGFVLFGLSACSHKKDTQSPTDRIVMLNLNQAADSVSDSLSQLAAIDKSTHPVAKVPFVELQGANLDRNITVTWNGPIAPLLQKVATAISYKLQIYGKPPLIPILVNIDTTGQQVSAKQVISNADLQAGTQASVMIFPDQQIISLRYLSL